MNPSWLPVASGLSLAAVGLHGLLAHRDLFRKILSFNVMGSGIFAILLATSGDEPLQDPVPHALVLTGIVVAVSATAFALILARRLHEETGRSELPEDDDG